MSTPASPVSRLFDAFTAYQRTAALENDPTIRGSFDTVTEAVRRGGTAVDGEGTGAPDHPGHPLPPTPQAVVMATV